MNLEALNQLLRSVPWERNGETIYPEARLLSQKDAVSMKSLLINMLIMFIASLILISGLINFLKFIIQMFYNRQREIALRKCMGASVKGLYLLLFFEVFWMMSFAFLISLVLMELSMSAMQIYIPNWGDT